MNQTPKYKVIVNEISEDIKQGKLILGNTLPSINQTCKLYNVSRDTVQKAFALLKEQGIIESIHGKAFQVVKDTITSNHRLFLLFDTLSPYKNILYQSIKDSFRDDTFIDIYYHHYNLQLFHQLIESSLGKYTSYIVMPFENKSLNNSLGKITNDRLFVLDRKPEVLNGDYPGVVQNFEYDIQITLSVIAKDLQNYQKFILLFRNSITEVPESLREGFISFCEAHKIDYDILTQPLSSNDLQHNCAYLCIDDEDLVVLVEAARSNNYELGKDLGILSYNDTPFKRIIGEKGVSVISTDFNAMGKEIARIIQTGDKQIVLNKANFMDRKSI